MARICVFIRIPQIAETGPGGLIGPFGTYIGMESISPGETGMTEQTRSDYAIENLLPAGERRFLKIRDEFMRITGNRVVDSCVLEILLFETVRLLGQLGPEEKAREYTLHYRQTQPLTESALWVELPNTRVVERLCGWTDSKRTIQRAVTQLEETGFIEAPPSEGRKVGSKRRVILNVAAVQEAINAAGYSEAEWGGPGSVEAIKGTTSLLAFPDAKYHALFPTFVKAIGIPSQEGGNTLAKMSLVLLEALFVADQRVSQGRGPEMKWSARDLHRAMRFGEPATWLNILQLLGASRLLIRRPEQEHDGARVYEPNLELIRASIEVAVEANDIDDFAQGSNPNTPSATSEHLKGQIRTGQETDPNATGDKSASGAVIPELLPKPSESMGGRDAAPVIEPVALQLPVSSLPRISQSDSIWTSGSLVRATGIPADLQGIDLAQLGLRPDVVEACSELDGVPIILSSGYRTGKTVLAAAIMWAFMEKVERRSSTPGRWINLEEITPDLRHQDFNSDAYKKAVERLMNHSTKGPIVLDGVDEAENKKLLGLMKDTVQKFVNSESQVIITTHLPKSELTAAFGPKMGSRLQDEAIIVDCSKPVWISAEAPALRVVSE